MRLHLLVAAAAFVSLTCISPVDAKPRPTVDSDDGDTCMNDPTTDKNCGGGSDVGSICYCCYDDGCWICGTTPLPGDACVWDPAYRPAGKAGKPDSPTIKPDKLNPDTRGQRLKDAPRMTPLHQPLMAPAAK